MWVRHLTCLSRRLKDENRKPSTLPAQGSFSLLASCHLPSLEHRQSFESQILSTVHAFKICRGSSFYWDKSPYHHVLLFLQNLDIRNEYRSVFTSTFSLQVNIACSLIWSCIVLLEFSFICYPLHRMTFLPHCTPPQAKFWSSNYVKYDLRHEQFEAISLSLRPFGVSYYILLYTGVIFKQTYAHSRNVNSQSHWQQFSNLWFPYGA